MGGSKVVARCLRARSRHVRARAVLQKRGFASSVPSASSTADASSAADAPTPVVPNKPEAAYSDFISRRLNEIHTTTPDGLTAQQLARAHYLLTPPPPSALSALANRIPGFPPRLTLDKSLGAIEQCLVSASFWEGVEDEDVPLDLLKQAVATYRPTRKGKGKDGSARRFLPGVVTGSTAPDQSLDANPRMQPENAQRRRILRSEQAVSKPKLRGAEIDPHWEETVPRFTNYLDGERLHNEQYAVLGNAVLGFLGAEWLDREYPNLPTAAYQAALTQYVGPRTCADISRLWGVSSGAGLSILTHEKRPALLSTTVFAGRQHEILTKNHNSLDAKNKVPKGHEIVLDKSSPGLLRWRRPGPDLRDSEEQSAWRQGVSYEDAMASVARAFVGLVFVKEGLGAARELVKSNWLNRRVEVVDLLKFTHPKGVLKSTLEQRDMAAPVGRLLRETGRLSATPVFIVGSYSGTTKIGEGFGSSLKMAEFRAHEDALRRLYLSKPTVSPDSAPLASLPTDTLVEPDRAFVAPSQLGAVEVVEGSSTRTGRRAAESIEEAMARREARSVQVANEARREAKSAPRRQRALAATA